MIESISYCQNCGLCKNQSPLLDHTCEGDILWVGLSAKRVKCIDDNRPLGFDTNSGMILEMVEKKSQRKFYHTNLVKCLPLDQQGKLRYPTDGEMEACILNLFEEIQYINPQIVFTLGNQVDSFIRSYIKKNRLATNTNFIKIKHPSYIYVYKRKFIDEYVNDILRLISENTVSEE